MIFTVITGIATCLLFVVGSIQSVVFWIQAGRLKQTIDKMDEISTAQSLDMANSIKAATRAAEAMEGVATEAAEQRALMSGQLAATKESLIAAKKAAEAAELSAKAAIGVELPSLHIEWLRLIRGSSTAFEDWKSGFTVHICVKNYGRTPAFVDDLIVNYSIGLVSPPKYVPQTNLTNTFVVPEKEKFEVSDWRYSHTIPFTDGDVDAILSGEKTLYVYGVIKYQDFLGALHTRGYIFLYVEKAGTFASAHWWDSHHYQT